MHFLAAYQGQRAWCRRTANSETDRALPDAGDAGVGVHGASVVGEAASTLQSFLRYPKEGTVKISCRYIPEAERRVDVRAEA